VWGLHQRRLGSPLASNMGRRDCGGLRSPLSFDTMKGHDEN
jgi:hypothetical protein